VAFGINNLLDLALSFLKTILKTINFMSFVKKCYNFFFFLPLLSIFEHDHVLRKVENFLLECRLIGEQEARMFIQTKKD